MNQNGDVIPLDFLTDLDLDPPGLETKAVRDLHDRGGSVRSDGYRPAERGGEEQENGQAESPGPTPSPRPGLLIHACSPHPDSRT